MPEQAVTVTDLFTIIGQKEVELILLRQRLAPPQAEAPKPAEVPKPGPVPFRASVTNG